MRRYRDRVLRELTLGGRTFQLFESLGRDGRERYRAFDPVAGPKGDYRAVLMLPQSPATSQHLAVLQRLADARNANVPFLIESHVVGGQNVLVLAWVKGTPLDQVLAEIAKGRRVSPSTLHLCKLVRGLAHGVCQLHHRWNVNHGDLKPANLILSENGGHLATIDFGSAWLTERTARRDSGDGVSGAYAAPELQIEGGIPSFRSDQFSLSVIWYELLTGRLPYDGCGGRAGLPSQREALEATLVPPGRSARSGGPVPRGLWSLIDATVCRGLAIEPDQRFPDRSAWLTPLDEIHHQFQRRRTLSGWNLRVVNWLTRRFSPRADVAPAADNAD